MKKNSTILFLQDNEHAQEVLTLMSGMMEAFEKLAPILSDETGEAFGNFLLLSNGDLARYLAEHVNETVKEIQQAQNN